MHAVDCRCIATSWTPWSPQEERWRHVWLQPDPSDNSNLLEEGRRARHWINRLRADVSSPEGNDQPASRPWRSAPTTSPPGGVFHRKAKPATRQGRRASLSIHGPDREVYKSLRWTELSGPRIKLDRTTRAASSRPHLNGTRRLTLEHCYAVRDIRSIGEQSGRTTGRLGSTGLQAMPSEGRHSWHSGAHPPPPSSPGRVTLSEDYGPGVAAGGWT